MTRAEEIILYAERLDSRLERTEFNKSIAPDAGVGCAARTILSLEIIKHFPLVCILHIDDMVFNFIFFTEFFALCNVDFFARTVAAFLEHFSILERRQVPLPQRHRDTYDFAAAVLEQN